MRSRATRRLFKLSVRRTTARRGRVSSADSILNKLSPQIRKLVRRAVARYDGDLRGLAQN